MKKKWVLLSSLMVLGLLSCGAPSPSSSISSADVSSSSLPELGNLSFRLAEDEASYEVYAKSKDIEGEVVIPDTYLGLPVTSVEEFGFRGCAKMTSLFLPASLIHIGEYAFYGCSSLKRVEIPAKVASIGMNAFGLCDELEGIDVDPNNEHYSSLGGAVLDKKQETFLLFPKAKGGAYTLPSSVTIIADYAFEDCLNLNEITLPRGLREIGEEAFASCKKLQEILLPESLLSIGQDCFKDCLSLRRIDVEENNQYYGSIDGVLLDKSLTRLILFPAAINGTYVVPESVSVIASCAFALSALSSIQLSSSVLAIEESAFVGSSLREIEFPDNVASLGSSCFEDCSSLMRVTIGSGITSLGDEVFSGCKKLESIDVSAKNPRYASLDGVLTNKAKATLLLCPEGKAGDYVLPDSITQIERHAFYECALLTSLELPLRLTSIGERAFYQNTSLASVEVNPANDYYSSMDGALFDKEMTKLLYFPSAKKGAYEIPGTVEELEPYAFACSALTSLSLSDKITSVSHAAFMDASSLRSITLCEGLKEIEEFAFAHCASLSSIQLPSTLDLIDDYAFEGCISLKSITFAGKMEQWNEIEKGTSWHEDVAATTVICLDGEVAL